MRYAPGNVSPEIPWYIQSLSPQPHPAELFWLFFKMTGLSLQNIGSLLELAARHLAHSKTEQYSVKKRPIILKKNPNSSAWRGCGEALGVPGDFWRDISRGLAGADTCCLSRYDTEAGRWTDKERETERERGEEGDTMRGRE